MIAADHNNAEFVVRSLLRAELENLIKGEEAVTKWVLADIEKYAEE